MRNIVCFYFAGFLINHCDAAVFAVNRLTVFKPTRIMLDPFNSTNFFTGVLSRDAEPKPEPEPEPLENQRFRLRIESTPTSRIRSRHIKSSIICFLLLYFLTFLFHSYVNYKTFFAIFNES